MKTMFVTPENNNGKKNKFQKPNILRRKPKGSLTKPNVTESDESPRGKSLVNAFAPKNYLPLEKIPKVKYSKPLLSKKPVQRVKLDNFIRDEDVTFNFSSDSNVEMKNSLVSPGDILLSTSLDDEENNSQSAVNIESFLNDSASTQNVMQYDIVMDNVIDIDSQVKQQWCFDTLNGTEQIIIEDFDGSQIGSTCMEQNLYSANMVSLSEISTHHQENISQESSSTEEPRQNISQESSSTEEPRQNISQESSSTEEPRQNISQESSSTEEPRQNISQEPSSTEEPRQNLTIEFLASSTMNFKCDELNCKKRFRSELKLLKHKNTHNPENVTKMTKHTTSECPVKRSDEDGKEEPCGRTFAIREDLVKHLNEEHSPDEALYVCSECDRRFFWACGLRAHARAHCERPAAHVCAWPGCGRVFRQPCRLREHARAHTGDKPYPCRYPDCRWSFRTASKLLRHARRHTGERRHACAACGRAFLRREHLRDHHARHHAHRHPCTHYGCQRTFNSYEALITHIEKVHKDKHNVDSLATIVPVSTAPLLPESGVEETYTISLDSSAMEAVVTTEVETVANVADVADVAEVADVEWHAARTHCTWPLPRVEPMPHETVDGELVLEEDVHVELSEGSESNIYTIRSDLFLHGNVLNNEDSGHTREPAEEDGDEETETEGRAEGGGSQLVVPHSGDTDLCLLNAHPTIDLMQEELMYTDAAVDESSLRVFLLSGEELG